MIVFVKYEFLRGNVFIQSFVLRQYKWLKLESPRRPRSKIARTTTTTGTNHGNHFDSKTMIDPTKLQRSKSTGSVSTEPRSDGIPWRTAARAARLPYIDLKTSSLLLLIQLNFLLEDFHHDYLLVLFIHRKNRSMVLGIFNNH